MFFTYLFCNLQCTLLPLAVVVIETPVTLVPTHLAYFLRHGVVIEMHIIAIRMVLDSILNFNFPFPLGNDE